MTEAAHSPGCRGRYPCPVCRVPPLPRVDSSGAEKTRDGLLRAALQMAVPLQLSRWREEGYSMRDIHHQAAFSGDVLAEKGDILQYGTKKKTKRAQREVADVFASFVRGLAALSFCPGGVDFLGVHFESSPEWLRQ